jgi:hypothetical protein
MSRAIKIRPTKRTSQARSAASSRVPRNSAWTIRHAGGLQIVESNQLAKLGWLVHGFSTRPGGESRLDGQRVLNLGFTDWDERKRVENNRAKFQSAMAAKKMRLVAMRQIHSDVIHLASGPFAKAPCGDALITHAPDLLLGVQTADCVPILLADTRRCVVAAVHAGWRGTLARIAVKALGRMQMEFGTSPVDVVAALGPSIGRCCYQVGSEVARAFAAQFPGAADWFDGPYEQLAYGEDPLWLPWLTMMPPGHVPPPPRVQLDLRASNCRQLIDAGLPEEQIDVSDLCTACRADLFFSYRREGSKSGRMVSAIGVLSQK